MKLLPVFRYLRVIVKFSRYFFSRLFFFIVSLASLSVNYSIYYFRKRVLGKSDQQARKMNDGEYTDYLNGQQNRRKAETDLYANSALEQKGEPTFNKGTLTEDNIHVNSLWIGNSLSKIELLTLYSFIKQGHTFHLWTYEKLTNELPEGVIIEDANKILPREAIFFYNHINKYGHGKGSVSGFSDIFRYKLLYEKGGWWVDMDVTCLKPLNVVAPYFFRKHHSLELVGNVMKAPIRSKLMMNCYQEAEAEVNENNTDWHKPIEILNKHVFENNLQQYVFPFVSNVDDWNQIVDFVVGEKPIPQHYYFIHWMNEEWRSRNIDKNDFRYRSALAQLMIEGGLLKKPTLPITYFLNDLKHLVLMRIYYYS